PSRPGRTPARLLLVLGGVALAFSLAASGGADSAPALLQRAHALRAERTALSARSHAALLRLYALDSELARARARLDRLTALAERSATLERLRRDAAATASTLAATRAQHVTYLADLRAKEQLDATRVASLESAAQAAQAKSAAIATAPVPVSTPSPPAAAPEG